MAKILPKIISFPTFLFLSFFLFIFLPSVVQAATLSVNPTSGSFKTGDRVALKVVVTSNGVPFNAVSGVLSISPSVFTIESVSKANSVLNFWVTEPNASAGTVKFEGVALGGFSGVSGTVVTINVRAIKAGTGVVSF